MLTNIIGKTYSSSNLSLMAREGQSFNRKSFYRKISDQRILNDEFNFSCHSAFLGHTCHGIKKFRKVHHCGVAFPWLGINKTLFNEIDKIIKNINE